MVALKLDIVFLLNIFCVSECARRIKDGEPVSTEKRYVVRDYHLATFCFFLTTQLVLGITIPLDEAGCQAFGTLISLTAYNDCPRSTYFVYLIKASVSDRIYDAWVCGGALVSTLFIVTSAACVDDVEFMYAIAGYKKYIKDEDIENDPCTKTMKKKVVYTCTPLKYELQYDKVEKWSFIDIALVKVESPYNFEDTSYKTICSYTPAAIPINYEPRYQAPGTDGFVLGWGHTENFRKPDDKMNYNQEILRYASTKIMDKEKCKERYDVYENMGPLIDKYMICTLEKGALNEAGEMVEPVKKPYADGCLRGGLRLPSDNGEPCDVDLTRRDVLRSNEISNNSNIAQNNRTKNINIVNETITETRKSGICQNDHGGPLVTWVGTREVLIGVASVFIVSKDLKCMGPYLYTSTQCNGAFLDCVLSSPNPGSNRRAICDSPPIQRGYDTVERYISWKNHPAGAAANEAQTREKNLLNKFNSYNDAKNAGVSKAIKEFIKVGIFAGNESIALRPQRPLEQ